MDERVNERNGCVDGCVVECKHGWLDGWMMGYMIGGMCALVFVSSRPAGPLAWRKARKPIGRGASGVDQVPVSLSYYQQTTNTHLHPTMHLIHPSNHPSVHSLTHPFTRPFIQSPIC